MLKIGITGGIGSGKTVVSRIFRTMGIPVYDADTRAKKIMQENHLVREDIIQLFGHEAYTDTYLNRTFISSIVFNDAEKLAQLNAIVHPVTLQDFSEWMQLQESPYLSLIHI